MSKALLAAPLTQLGAESQLQDLLGREVHPVRLECVPLHLGDEVCLVSGVNLEPAIASK